MPGVKSSFTKKSNKSVSKTDEGTWWRAGVNETEKGSMLDSIASLGTRYSNLPNGAGGLKMFKKAVGVRMKDVETMSVPDENNKICLELSEECYEYLKEMESMIARTLVMQLKAANPNYEGAEFKSCVKESESTGKKYLKTKIKTLGLSRTLGVNEKGENVLNCPEALRVQGTKVCVRVRVDGAYAGSKNCGLVTSIDMFKVVSVPDEKAIEEARKKRKEEMENRRAAELMEEEF